MDAFEAHRPHLHAVATRILGSRAEADDALQEAWLRINRADTIDVDNIRGWLTTLASRARRRVQGADRDAPTADRQIVDAFLAAARGGDFAGLLAVLDPDVVLRTDDGNGALQIIEGARAVATRARFFSIARVAHPAIVDGAAGFVATEAGVPVAVLAFTVLDGRVTAIDALTDPARVAGLGLEAFVAN